MVREFPFDGEEIDPVFEEEGVVEPVEGDGVFGHQSRGEVAEFLLGFPECAGPEVPSVEARHLAAGDGPMVLERVVGTAAQEELHVAAGPTEELESRASVGDGHGSGLRFHQLVGAGQFKFSMDFKELLF